jgi:hypothetical protein
VKLSDHPQVARQFLSFRVSLPDPVCHRILVVETTLPLSEKQDGYDHTQLGSFVEFVGGPWRTSARRRPKSLASTGPGVSSSRTPRWARADNGYSDPGQPERGIQALSHVRLPPPPHDPGIPFALAPQGIPRSSDDKLALVRRNQLIEKQVQDVAVLDPKIGDRRIVQH